MFDKVKEGQDDGMLDLNTIELGCGKSRWSKESEWTTIGWLGREVRSR
jgi:hypothetical protein